MQPSEYDEIASSKSGPVKWKVRKVCIRDFPKSFQPPQIHIANSSADRNIGFELFENKVGSQENVAMVGKVVLKQDKLEAEEVNARVDSNLVEPLRIRLYPSPKRRNVAVVRDFPIACKQSGEQVNQFENDIKNDIQFKKSLINKHKHSFQNDPEEDSDSEGEFEQISQEENQEIKEHLTYDDVVCESDDSLINSEILALIEDVGMESEHASGEVDQEIKEHLTYESEDSLMNPEILALIEDVGMESEHASGEVDQEIKEHLTYESEDSLMNPEILALIEDVEVESNGVSRVSYDQNQTVKQDGTDLTGLTRSNALKIPRRRVSAIRCFPPGCGRNAVRLSKEELEKALAESKNHCLSCSCAELEEERDEVVVEEEMVVRLTGKLKKTMN